VSTDITEKKRREDELRAVEEHHRVLESILDCAADGIVVVDAAGRFTEFNAAAERILGIGATGTSLANWSEEYGAFRADTTTPLGPDEHPLVRALAGEHVDNYRIFIRNDQRPGGVWIAVSARPLAGRAGHIEGAVATFQDITERTHATQALSDAHADLARKEAHLREAQRIARIGSWDWDLTTNRHDWSDELFRLVGVTPPGPDANLEPRLAELLHPDDLELTRRALDQAIEERGRVDIETRLMPRGGDVRTVRMEGRVECDAAGAAVRMVGATQDITESKAAQTQLASQLRFQQREQEIARRLHELSDIASISDAVLNGLRELFDADVGVVCLPTADGTRVEEYAAFGLDGAGTPKISTDADAAGIIPHVMRTEEPVRFFLDRNDAHAPDSLARRHDLNGPGVVLPLRARGRALGIVGILRQEEDDKPQREFTQDDVERMTPLVTDLALAIDNARLYEQVREHALSLERVVAAASCLLWHGEVHEHDDWCEWSFAPMSEEAAQKVFPVDVPEGQEWHSVVGHARLPEDDARMNATADDALRSGVSRYSQDYRAIDKHGQMHWLHEDVQLFPLAEGRWRTVGVTTDVTARKQAEEEVRRSEAHFRGIFEDGPLGMAIVDGDMTLTDVNDTLCRMLGYSRDELLGMNTAALAHPDEAESTLEQTGQVMAGTIPSFRAERRLLKKGGDVLWVRLTASAVRDADGEPICGIRMVEDISRQKQDELLRRALYDIAETVHTTSDIQAMCASIYRSLTALIDAPGFAIALTRRDEPDTFDAVYDVLHGRVSAPRQTVLPRTRSALVVSTRVPLCLTRSECVRMADTGEIDPDMQDPSAYLGVPLEMGGELIGIVVAWHPDEEAPYSERDVEIMTLVAEQIAVALDRRRTQEELTQERNLFQDLMAAAPDAIYFKDTDHRFTRVSRSCAASMGLADARTAIGQTDHDLQASGADAYRLEEERVLRTGEALTDSLQHSKTSEGGDAWTLNSIAPTRDAEGRVTGLVGINRTVTELIRIQEALRDSETGRTQLMERMLTVQEEERARIARELHDQVGQELTSVLLGLRIADARTQIQELREVTASTLEDVRQIAFEMRPSSLEDLGIGPALERDLSIMAQGAGFTPEFRLYNPGDLPLTTAVELGIYRIVPQR
jgi:PAS domain S-box-containing protein